jgi:hypothetical protein
MMPQGSSTSPEILPPGPALEEKPTFQKGEASLNKRCAEPGYESQGKKKRRRRDNSRKAMKRKSKDEERRVNHEKGISKLSAPASEPVSTSLPPEILFHIPPPPTICKPPVMNPTSSGTKWSAKKKKKKDKLSKKRKAMTARDQIAKGEREVVVKAEEI